MVLRLPLLPLCVTSVLLRRRMMTSTAFPLVDELTSDRPGIHVARPDRVERLLAQLLTGGPQQLQFVVDFDYTLTRVHRDGRKVDCSWGVLENSVLLPQSYTDQTNALREKYWPIETDHSLTVNQKIPHMIEWYERANGLLADAGINKDMFTQMVEASNVEFRTHTDKMLGDLKEMDVPVLVLSAGLGDLVVDIMRKFDVLSDNVKVVSNFVHFDSEGRVGGLERPMIHMFNKNESAVHDSPYFKRLQDRHHVVLMGDSVGDLHMADGVQGLKAILKIGFLNSHCQEKLKTYKELYDVVLVDDQTMDVANWIINKMKNNNKS